MILIQASSKEKGGSCLKVKPTDCFQKGAGDFIRGVLNQVKSSRSLYIPNFEHSAFLKISLLLLLSSFLCEPSISFACFCWLFLVIHSLNSLQLIFTHTSTTMGILLAKLWNLFGNEGNNINKLYLIVNCNKAFILTQLIVFNVLTPNVDNFH